jgi:isopenicillin-N N-acyltransferase-like protein
VTAHRFESSPAEPFERGWAFGRAHRDELERTVAAYRDLFAASATVPFDLADWSERAWTAIKSFAPRAADEIDGLALGARLPVTDIAALNARTELLAAADPTGGVSECSTLVALRTDRPAISMQTWDWYDAMRDNWLHWRIVYPDGRTVETVTEFGILAKIGVNDRGLGVHLNLLHHDNDEPGRIGYPVHLLSRRLLEDAATVDEAIAICNGADTSASTALTVATADDAATVELFPGGPGIARADDGLLVRTNHFISDEGYPGCRVRETLPGSVIRRDSLLTAFADRLPADEADVLAAMRTHATPGGVCAHPDTTLVRPLQAATLATVAIDFAEHRLDVREGGPCGQF